MTDCPKGPYHFWEWVEFDGKNFEICISCGLGTPDGWEEY